jgi:ATP-dependent helicase/DNAse subunit B
LEIDQEAAPFQILSMEQAYQAKFKIDTAKGKVEVGLEGYIDRVDEQRGTVRLIDYKSGADKKVFSSIESLFDREDKNRNKAAMQTMYYGLLYQAMHPENRKPLKPALFNFKEIFKEDFNPYLQLKEPKGKAEEVGNYNEYAQIYETGLKQLLEDLFDPDVPFSQTDNWDKCKYCAYKEICGR